MTRGMKPTQRSQSRGVGTILLGAEHGESLPYRREKLIVALFDGDPARIHWKALDTREQCKDPHTAGAHHGATGSTGRGSGAGRGRRGAGTALRLEGAHTPARR